VVLSAVAAAAPIAEYRDDKLTVHMARTPITECVRALESATGASIRGRIPDKGEVTIALESVPLREGLGRIFGESNFTITYKNDGRPSAVQVLGGPLPVLTAQPQAKDASPPPSNGGPADAQTVAQARVTLQASWSGIHPSSSTTRSPRRSGDRARPCTTCSGRRQTRRASGSDRTP